MTYDCNSFAIQDMQHFGKKLKGLRERLGLSQPELAAKIGVSAKRVSDWEQMVQPAARGFNLVKLADALGITRAELEGETTETLDPNITPYSEREVPEIPLFDLPIAAGTMTALPEVEENDERQRLVLAHKRFRVKIRGDSMEKEYADESIVEFVCLQWRQDGTVAGMEVGKDFYVQAAEEATFKRLKSFSNEELVFVAINRKKFPKDIRLKRIDVNRMAKAVAIIQPKG